jgi:hypothetical protein
LLILLVHPEGRIIPTVRLGWPYEPCRGYTNPAINVVITITTITSEPLIHIIIILLLL